MATIQHDILYHHGRPGASVKGKEVVERNSALLH